MTAGGISVRLWGVRGSLPVSGADNREFGGNTMCIEMRCGPHVLFFDAGSGLAPAGMALATEGLTEAAIYFTHWHYDHVLGLPFFAPFFDPATTITLRSGHNPAMSTDAMLSDFMRAPFFPVGPDCFRARIRTDDFKAGDVLTPHPGLTIRTRALNHPGGSVGYRVEWGGRAVSLITDTEHRPGTLDPGVLSLVRAADLMLYDTNYQDGEFDRYAGFGHSTWEHAIRLADEAGAARLCMVHHSIRRSDDDLRGIDAAARERMPTAFCGREGQVIDV